MLEIDTLKRLKTELDSFKLLTTASMFGAAITLAYCIVYGFTLVFPILTGEPIDAAHLPYILVVISGLATAISWITRSAELIDKHDEIIKELNKIIAGNKDEEDLDESVLGIIVRSLAFYRENNEKIHRLIWSGRLTGALILIISIIQLISFLNGAGSVDSIYVLIQILVVVISIGVSIAAWYVPVIIRRFMDTWDVRLKLAEDAGIRLGRLLEGNE